jgi:hypothetical protein
LRIVVVRDQPCCSTEPVEARSEVQMVGVYSDAGNEGEHFAALLVDSHRPRRAIADAREVLEQYMYGRRPRARGAANGVADPNYGRVQVPAPEWLLGFAHVSILTRLVQTGS